MTFGSYGAHCASYPHKYLTAAAALGTTCEDVDELCVRLLRCFQEYQRKSTRVPWGVAAAGDAGARDGAVREQEGPQTDAGSRCWRRSSVVGRQRQGGEGTKWALIGTTAHLTTRFSRTLDFAVVVGLAAAASLCPLDSGALPQLCLPQTHSLLAVTQVIACL
jgi:hypothetical protein